MARLVTGLRIAVAPLPQWVRPQLTQLVDAASDGDQWLHEIKYDGYRMHVRLDRGRVKLLTRTGLDWTHKYPAIWAGSSTSCRDRARASPGACSVPLDSSEDCGCRSRNACGRCHPAALLVVGKMKAAISARQDNDLVVAGRTSALTIANFDEAVKRAKAYETAGVDAIFLAGG